MTAATIFLNDYRPSAFAIEGTELDFDLHLTKTRVRARTIFERVGDTEPLVLDGENLNLVEIRLDGKLLTENDYAVSDSSLTVFTEKSRFELETTVEIDPSSNDLLTGMYVSGGRFCTQCEAEGFRRITFFLDRPDVLTRYTVRITAEKSIYPTLLSNGNCIETGDIAGGRHYSVWYDPHPKPSYLFAVVAGDFETIADTFQTMSGKSISLFIHVDRGNGARAYFAMDALKRSMKWDEDVFMREYDLSEFHIVAVRDFNAGAMENKGLNVFNASAVLADSASETDDDFARVEQVVAHEYFHNWTGNRITLRDWFQLCLKEGLTVYRDQEFRSDQNSRDLQRINDVEYLRAYQFPEDAGPFAHPVRPDRFEKIDNFYTPTVYRKGAALVRVLSHILGNHLFAEGMQHYFETFDGQAVTVEDFISSFEAVSGKSLSTFFRWYLQAGTPVVTSKFDYDSQGKRLILRVCQETFSTPGQPEKEPVPIPLRVGFIDCEGAILSSLLDGDVAEEHSLLLTNSESTWTFEDVDRRPIPALMRGSPAPVVLKDGLSFDEQLIQMRYDPDSFTRWDVGQRLIADCIIRDAEGRHLSSLSEGIAIALSEELSRAEQDPALVGRLLTLPTLSELIQVSGQPDPDALDDALRAFRLKLSVTLDKSLLEAVRHSAAAGQARTPYSIGRRALKCAALHLLAEQGDLHGELIDDEFAKASNMTLKLASLQCLGSIGGERFGRALDRFEKQWRHEPLVIDKWFAIQARSVRSNAAEEIRRLANLPTFNLRNPNRARAVYGVFASANLRQFHGTDGSGYRLLGDVVLEADGFNPSLAGRFLRAFDSWRKFDETRQSQAREVLTRLGKSHLSAVQRELIEKLLV